MRLVLTDDKGVATLKAAGIACQEVSLPGTQLQTTATPPPPVQMSRPRGLPVVPVTRPQRWSAGFPVMIGDKAPDDGDHRFPAWAARKTREEFQLKNLVFMSRAELTQILIEHVEIEPGIGSPRSVSSTITQMLDAGYLKLAPERRP